MFIILVIHRIYLIHRIVYLLSPSFCSFVTDMSLLDFYYSCPWDKEFSARTHRNPWLLNASLKVVPDYHPDIKLVAQVGTNTYPIPDELIQCSPVLTRLRRYLDGPINLSHLLTSKECKKIFRCIRKAQSVPPHLLITCTKLCDYLDVSFPLYLRLINCIYSLSENYFHRFANFLYLSLLTIYRPIGEWFLLQGLGMPPSILNSSSAVELLDIGMKHIKKRKRRIQKLKISINKILLPDPFYSPESWD